MRPGADGTAATARALRVLMLLENNPFPQDVRVRSEALSLARAGHRVTVIAPRGGRQVRAETVDGVHVLRYATPPSLPGAAGYLVEYGYALAAMLTLSLWVLARRGVDVVHAHNPPDLLVVVASLLRLLGGARFVFDLHDLSPEMYRARFQTEDAGALYRALLVFERLSFRAADHVIVTNGSYAEVARGRGGVAPERITIVRNGPDLDRVRRVPPDPSLRGGAPHLIGYVGEMGPQDGVDYLLRALRHLRDELARDDWRCVLVGRGDAVPELEAMTHELGLDDRIAFLGFRDGEDLMRVLSTVDVFVAPEPSNAYTDKSTVIKLIEYLVFGRPIVAFDLPEHRVTAGDAALYARPNDEADFARALTAAFDDRGVARGAARAARERLSSLTWRAQEPQLLGVYARLADDRR